MDKVFVDTNVLLDFVLAREGEQDALDIFQMGEDSQIELVVSFLTMANIAYIARKHRTREELYEYLGELSSLFHILPMDEEQYKKALSMVAPDFEDLLQYMCASNAACDFIITNNTRHFLFSNIPVLTPSQFLKRN